MNVLFIGDLHLDHKSIPKYRRLIETVEQNTEMLKEAWHSVVSKRSLVWVMGDAAFSQKGLDELSTWAGRKVLVRGNHDQLPIRSYTDVFEDVHGITKKYGMWLTHCPIHPNEMYRASCNVHGHSHTQEHGEGFINVCADWLDGFKPISLDEIREGNT